MYSMSHFDLSLRVRRVKPDISISTHGLDPFVVLNYKILIKLRMGKITLYMVYGVVIQRLIHYIPKLLGNGQKQSRSAPLQEIVHHVSSKAIYAPFR